MTEIVCLNGQKIQPQHTEKEGAATVLRFPRRWIIGRPPSHIIGESGNEVAKHPSYQVPKTYSQLLGRQSPSCLSSRHKSTYIVRSMGRTEYLTDGRALSATEHIVR